MKRRDNKILKSKVRMQAYAYTDADKVRIHTTRSHFLPAVAICPKPRDVQELGLSTGETTRLTLAALCR